MLLKIKVSLFLMLIILMVTGTVFADKVATLDDLLKPKLLYVDTDRYYVVEDHSVFIYSLANNQLITKFGKKGEGPREFNRVLLVSIADGKLVVNSRGKVSLYTRDGEFIQEKRPTTRSFIFKPMGQQFVGYQQAADEGVRYWVINLYDDKLKKVKELNRYKFTLQQHGKFNLYEIFRWPLLANGNGSIYVQGAKDGVIQCFDTKGKQLHTITPQIEPVPFTKQEEKKLREFLSKDVRYDGRYARFGARSYVPEFYPAIKALHLDGDKLYLVTHKRAGGPRMFECIVMDLKGNILKRGQVHIRTTSPLLEDEFPYHIKDGKFYQVIENEDDEEIELHVTEI
ncbi:MAG: hypothetical protein GY940_18590 [bacterium]|nr:hypothetical protein [bacterium]